MTERREPGKCQNFVFCKGNKKQQNTALKLSLYWVCLIKAISLPKSWQKKIKIKKHQQNLTTLTA